MISALPPEADYKRGDRTFDVHGSEECSADLQNPISMYSAPNEISEEAYEA